MADVDVGLRLPVLRRGGNRPPNVVARLQDMLKWVGKLQGFVVDDDFGPKTEEAVKGYQQNQGKELTVDGIVGQQTWTSLFNRWLFESQPS